MSDEAQGNNAQQGPMDGMTGESLFGTMPQQAGNDGQGDGQQQQQTGEGQGQSGEGQGEGASQPVQLTKEAIAELVKGITAGQPPAQQAQPEQKMTQDEINKALNIFNATDQHLARLGLGTEPEKVAAFNEVLSSVVRQAVTMAHVQMLSMQNQFRSQIDPIQKFVQQQSETALRQEFFAEHKDLSKFEPLVEAVYLKMVHGNVKFNTKQEAFKAVADQVRELVKKVQPNPQGEQQNGQGQVTQQRRMPTVTTGGRGGAAASGGSAQSKVAQTMFGTTK